MTHVDHHPLLRSSRRRAFTLMEILLAMTIFAITMAAVGTAIHTSVRAWRVGHGMSEITETARLTQDVLERDLGNLIFMPEGAYNRVFKQQIQMMAQQRSSDAPGAQRRPRRNDDDDSSRRGRRDRDRARDRDRGTDTDTGGLSERERDRAGNATTDPFGGLTLSDVATPIDLSFRATNNAKTDELSFARLQPARWEGDPETGGIRRVRYYVKDKTLYREETDPYGSRAAGVVNGNPEDEMQAALYELLQLYRRDDDKSAGGNTTNEPQPSADLKAEMAEVMPTRVRYAEPICEGVEIFDFSFGYFKNGEWWEVQDWDSDARRYRNPPEAEDEDSQRENRRRGRPTAPVDRDSQTAMSFLGRSGRQGRQPDYLPGYFALQLGVRPADGRGRLHSFTFYTAMPIAQENDLYDPDKFADGPPPQGVQASELGSRRLANDRHRNAFDRNRNDDVASQIAQVSGQGQSMPGVPPGWAVSGGDISGTETRY